MIKKITATLFTFMLVISNPVLSKDNTLFTPQQSNGLKSLDFPIIAPNWIPKGFKIDKVQIQLVTQQNPGGINNYEIIYRSDDYQKAFKIESQGGGIGDIMEEPNLEVKTIFGKVYVYTKLYGKCVSTGWIDYKGKGYMFTGCNSNYLDKKDMDSTSISKEDALKIIQSLKVIK